MAPFATTGTFVACPFIMAPALTFGTLVIPCRTFCLSYVHIVCTMSLPAVLFPLPLATDRNVFLHTDLTARRLGLLLVGDIRHHVQQGPQVYIVHVSR